MLLIYGTENALDLKFKMETRQDRYAVTEVVPWTVGWDSLEEAIGRHDSVIINDVPGMERNDILKYCYSRGIRTYVVPKITDIIIKGAPDITLFDTPLMLVRGRGLSKDQETIKRIEDLLLCLVAFIPFVVVLIFTALAIKIDDHGPVFFTQDRVTKGGKVFRMYKFRSMKVHSEKEETYHGAEENDPRITRVGRIIRRFRIDETPQLINILKGDMSWVGPRAEHLVDLQNRTAEVEDYPIRLKVKAGLTGYAQIYGKYNTSSYDKLRLDLLYIEKYSILMDIKLILMTVRIIFKKESTEGVDKREELIRRREELLKR
jgi:lipopolysaccharide/colanic/teichoic acid biosynthesis glycosyltransferase